MRMQMKVFFLLLTVFILFLPSAPLFAQDGIDCDSGQVLEGLSLQSSTLGESVEFAVYLPPDYECTNRRYPVVYLLHGYTDDETGWIQFGEAPRIVDREINAGEIPPMIIAMPDGGVTFYIDDPDGNVRYETMFTEEFIPHVDAEYRTRPASEFRGISGLSMGGYGSLILAMHNPELFSACAAFSSAVRTDDEIMAIPDQRWDEVYGPPYGKGLSGTDRLTDHYRRNSVLDLARSMPREELEKVRWFIDCGDDDFLTIGNASLHIELTRREIPHQYRVRDGGHSWSYWRTGLPEGLKFIGQGFRR